MSIEQNEFSQMHFRRKGSIRPILTRYERHALGILKTVTGKLGMAVFPKLRISDVLPVIGSEISDELYCYGLTEYFDFTITLDTIPVLAIEFDGPEYAGESCTSNNRIKNNLCDQLKLPLLRVDTQYLRKIATFTTLELVVEEILSKLISPEWCPESRIHYRHERNSEGADLDIPALDSLRTNTANRFMSRRLGITSASELISKIAARELVSNSGQLFLAKRLSKSQDNFFTGIALAVLDEDTAIIGVGSVFANPTVPLDAIELADALSVIDVLDQIRLFDESRYAGLEMRHALEFLAHFKEYTADEAGSRFLSLNPLCKPLTSQWLQSG